MNCEEAEDLIAVNAVESPGSPPPPSVMDHVRSCARCTASVAAYGEIANDLALTVPEVKPTAELRHRILAAVYADASAPEQPARRSTLGSLWTRVPQGRGWVAALAIAAVLLGVFGVVRTDKGAPPVATAVQVISVVGTTEQPSARGNITYDAATQTAVVDVVNLQPLAAGAAPTKSSYEVWLIKKDHSPVAVGFLTLQPDGTHWTTALHFSNGEYDEMAVTTEPAGGSPTPTGPPVVTASL